MNLLHQIQPLLSKLGLNITEQSVYLAGLSLGPSTILQLAEQSKLKRLTVHQAVQSLVDQGIMMETYYGKRRLVYPNNADGLRLLLEEKKFALRQLEQELESSKSVFDAIITARNSFSNTRLYHGIEGINTTLLEIAHDGQDVYLLYDANALAHFIDEKIFHRSYTQRAKKNVRTKLIVPDNFRDVRHLERKDDYDVSIRTTSHPNLINGGIEIRWHKVALQCYSAWSKQMTTTIIENKEIAQILLVMYDAMRNSARDYQERFLLV